MIAWFRRRYLDLLGSIYIYNEHRGYTSLDRVLQAVRARAPDDHALIAAIEKHRADERKHYLMFKRWFELRGQMPLQVDRTCGHIDRFVEIMFPAPSTSSIPTRSSLTTACSNASAASSRSLSNVASARSRSCSATPPCVATRR